jgi:hypothetical protein
LLVDLSVCSFVHGTRFMFCSWRAIFELSGMWGVKACVPIHFFGMGEQEFSVKNIPWHRSPRVGTTLEGRMEFFLQHAGVARRQSVACTYTLSTHAPFCCTINNQVVYKLVSVVKRSVTILVNAWSMFRNNTLCELILIALSLVCIVVCIVADILYLILSHTFIFMTTSFGSTGNTSKSFYSLSWESRHLYIWFW